MTKKATKGTKGTAANKPQEETSEAVAPQTEATIPEAVAHVEGSSIEVTAPATASTADAPQASESAETVNSESAGEPSKVYDRKDRAGKLLCRATANGDGSFTASDSGYAEVDGQRFTSLTAIAVTWTKAKNAAEGKAEKAVSVSGPQFFKLTVLSRGTTKNHDAVIDRLTKIAERFKDTPVEAHLSAAVEAIRTLPATQPPRRGRIAEGAAVKIKPTAAAKYADIVDASATLTVSKISGKTIIAETSGGVRVAVRRVHVTKA